MLSPAVPVVVNVIVAVEAVGVNVSVLMVVYVPKLGGESHRVCVLLPVVTVTVNVAGGP
jgi:hypothetical protein